MTPASNTPIKPKEWKLHPEKFTYYILGNPESRFAITRVRDIREWRLPWQRPRGGWCVGSIIVWWSL